MADPRNASDSSAPKAAPGGASDGLGGAGGPGLASAPGSPTGAPVRRRFPMPPPDDQGRAFDGCHRACAHAVEHDLRWGYCTHADEPPPTVSLSRVYTDPGDGHRFISFSRYTPADLAEIIEPALHDVDIRLGPDALAMLGRGEEVGLSGGEIGRLALAAADAIVTHSNRDGT